MCGIITQLFLITDMLSILGLGFALGLKHALDADHLVAVSTIVSERKGLLSSSMVGILWGLGHTASLFVVGILIIALQIQIHEKVSLALEFCVAAMLIVLGGRVLWKLSRGGKYHLHIHSHGGTEHIHAHFHDPDELHSEKHQAQEHSHNMRLGDRLSEAIKNVIPSRSMRLRSILVGLVHGLAGSGALMLLVLSTIPSPVLGLVYIGIFGIGSMAGMLLMSTLISIPFVASANMSAKVNLMIRGAAGLLSVGFGLILAWQIGYVDGLFQ